MGCGEAQPFRGLGGQSAIGFQGFLGGGGFRMFGNHGCIEVQKMIWGSEVIYALRLSGLGRVL